jgi:hypothetical protein
VDPADASRLWRNLLEEEWFGPCARGQQTQACAA